MPIAGSRQDARPLSGIHAFSFSSQVGTALTLFKGQVLSEGGTAPLSAAFFSAWAHIYIFFLLWLWSVLVDLSSWWPKAQVNWPSESHRGWLAKAVLLQWDERSKKERTAMGDMFMTSETVRPPSFKSRRTVEFWLLHAQFPVLVAKIVISH